jgi:peptide chain release factor 3
MQTEYGAESRLEQAPGKVVRWVKSKTGQLPDDSLLPTGARVGWDPARHPVIFFQDDWSCDFFAQRNPDFALSALPEAIEVQPATAV